LITLTVLKSIILSTEGKMTIHIFLGPRFLNGPRYPHMVLRQALPAL
jgi:hypothetical protein